MMMINKKIYLLLTDTGTLFTKLIKLFTKKRYNHASIALDAELLNVYSFGRKKVHNPVQGGFVKEDVEQRFFQHADCAIYSLPVTESQLEQMKRFIRNIEEEEKNYRYHFLGLFGFILNKPITREKAFFCSQFVATVLMECDIMEFEKPLSLVAPFDLLEDAAWRLEYEGKLKDYPHQKKSDDFSSPVFLPVENV